MSGRSSRACVGLIVAAALVVCVCNDTAAQPLTADGPATNHRFDFGSGAVADGYVRVTPGMNYTDARGFGFEPGPPTRAFDRGGGDALTRDLIASDQPFHFSVAVPEGNYRVAITFGDQEAATESTVRAELRRLMLEQVTTRPGEFVAASFVVNVRVPQFAGGEVRLKGNRERVQEARAWDQRITLEFNGTRPGVAAIAIEPVDVPTVYIIGDSTSCDQMAEPYSSWGQMITRFFEPTVAVANHGESGESIAASLNAGRFAKIYSQLGPGDYLFVQFGHNDMKSSAPDALERYTRDLRQIVADTRQRGATPVLITPVQRRTFDENGEIINSLLGYPDAVRRVAWELNAPLIDLHAMSKLMYEAWTPDRAYLAFAGEGPDNDATHHNNYGSYELARAVVQGILDAGLELADAVAADFRGYDPAQPAPFGQFDLPPSPLSEQAMAGYATCSCRCAGSAQAVADARSQSRRCAPGSMIGGAEFSWSIAKPAAAL